MDNIYSTPLTKAVLTGVFTGLITTVLCMVYNSIFRGSTGFSHSYIINVSSLIFFITPVFLLIGIIYNSFLRIRKGEILYILLFIVITVLLSIRANQVHRSDVPVINMEFHHLLAAIVIIMGLGASFGIPYLFHNKKFEENVL